MGLDGARRFNAMIAPFGTGPTSFSFVLWDQAESDSFPQTNPGYYGCQTLAHVNTWRELFRVPLLPWVFVHLQPYTGSEQGTSEVEQAAGRLYVLHHGNPSPDWSVTSHVFERGGCRPVRHRCGAAGVGMCTRKGNQPPLPQLRRCHSSAYSSQPRFSRGRVWRRREPNGSGRPSNALQGAEV